jgi:hypothetical protein
MELNKFPDKELVTNFQKDKRHKENYWRDYPEQGPIIFLVVAVDAGCDAKHTNQRYKP